VSVFQTAADPAASHPVTAADLIDYFHAGAKPRDRWQVGAEFEKFAVERATGRPLSYDEPGGVRDILRALADRFGWTAHAPRGRVVLLTRDGATVSIEPGNQVEFSSPPVERLSELEAHLRGHVAELRAVTDPDRVAWVAAGVTPFCRAEELPPPVRLRHQLMAEVLPARCETAEHMMKATASTQAAFDYADEADAVRKFAVALTLSPVVNALWGNSPLYNGRPSGWCSYRGRVWLGMDADRSGLLTELLADGLSFERWANHLLDVPMLFTRADGQYHPSDGRTFRDFLARGIDGRFPTRADWELHITTVFPEVRLKQFLEVRGADANPPPLALAVPAMWKGLLYSDTALSAATELAKRFPPAELDTLFEEAAQHGLAAEFAGRPVRDWARDVANLAAAGLPADERRFLDPVFAVLEAGKSPGMGWEGLANLTPAEVLPRFEYA
jgi:glutamate--cysteine ligase